MKSVFACNIDSYQVRTCIFFTCACPYSHVLTNNKMRLCLLRMHVKLACPPLVPLFFPNQACLWGPYFLFRNSLLVRGRRVPPECPGGSPAMIIQFPGPLLGCPKNTNPQNRQTPTPLLHIRTLKKQKSPKIAQLQHRCYISGR